MFVLTMLKLFLWGIWGEGTAVTGEKNAKKKKKGFM